MYIRNTDCRVTLEVTDSLQVWECRMHWLHGWNTTAAGTATKTVSFYLYCHYLHKIVKTKMSLTACPFLWDHGLIPSTRRRKEKKDGKEEKEKERREEREMAGRKEAGEKGIPNRKDHFCYPLPYMPFHPNWERLKIGKYKPILL